MVIEEKIIVKNWKANLDHINELCDKYGCDAVLLDDFEGGIIGWRLEKEGREYHLHVIYEQQAMCEYMTEKNKLEDIMEAYEWLDCNTIRALSYVDGDVMPIIYCEIF